MRNGRFGDRPDWFAGSAIEDVQIARLAGQRDYVNFLAVLRDGGQLRGGDVVVVPQIVVHILEVPHQFTGAASSASRQFA